MLKDSRMVVLNLCLGNGEPYSYIVCNNHNRCEICGVYRHELKGETAWGMRSGWQCDSRYKKEHNDRKSTAIELAR